MSKLTHFLCGRFLTAAGLLALSAIAAHADYKSVILGDHPLAYYAINPGVDGGSTCPDLTTNANDGAAFNITPVAGPTPYITNAANFNGAAAVDLSGGANPTRLDFGGLITMEAWIQPASTVVGSGPPADIFGKGYDEAQHASEIALRCNGGYYFAGTYNNTNGGASASGGQQSTNWTYLVGTFDGAKWNLYINGKLINQGADTVGALNFSDPWRIGTGSVDGTPRYFTGNISQAALYNTALSSNQVLNHFFVGEIGVAATNTAALITVQPQSQSSFAGGNVTFTVDYLSAFTATTNQWFKGNVAIAGKTNKSLTLTNVQSADATNYSVRIGNSFGTTNSLVATLTLLAAGNSLRWSSNANTGVWDAGSSANWINVSNSQQVVFNSGDKALFDDSTGVPTTVTKNTSVSPALTTISSSVNNFIIGGSGTISGPGGIVKTGNSTLEMATANDFTGPVTIGGGTVQMDEPLSGAATSLGAITGASIVVSNGATLAVNASGGYPAGNSGIGTRAVTITGSGIGGLGALRSIGNDIYHDGSPSGGLFRALTLAGDATIGSAGRFDVGEDGLSTFISTGGKNFNLTVLEGNYSEWHQVTIDTNLGNINYTAASGNYWVLDGMGDSLGNPTNTITLSGNVQMQIQHDGNGGDNGYAKIIHVPFGSQFGYRPGGGAGDYHLDTVLQLDGGSSWYFFNGNGGNNTGITLRGRVTLNGMTHLSIGDSPITFTNVIDGSGGFVLDVYNNQMVLAASNTYSGPTVVGSTNGNPQVTLTGNGSISHSSLIFFGGTDSTVVHMDVSGRTDGKLTLASGQTLAGIGTLTGTLAVNPGATLSPAGSNTSDNGITTGTNLIGTIAVSGAVTLSGNTVIKLNGSGVNDVVQAGGAITYGGTLTLTNVSGSPLAAGNSFQIFSASGYSGSFTFNPTIPGPSLVWDKSQLNSGVVGVIAGTPQPVFGSVLASGTNLVFNGSGGSANGIYTLLATTNITTPLTNWVPVLTNTFDSNGLFNVTNAINPGVPDRFYIIKQ